MPKYHIMIPIAGHIELEIEADSQKAAKEKAFNTRFGPEQIQYEALDAFMTGNVCHCPEPWEIEIEELDAQD